MSEGNVPPRSHDADSLDAAQGQLPLNPDMQSAADDGWETVPLMGMPPLSSPDASNHHQPSHPASSAAKEAELHSRIMDLNQCNEVLLSRINQLEEALERSQQALQQEVERSQRLTEEDKVAAAQNHSVAQLLSELDTANESLKRQTLLAETLTAQLKSAEERAERLEKECAILRKRKSERAKQLQASEEICTDLRSRLQRQQQYTLQFKAALEKCLDTPAFQHTSNRIENGVDETTDQPSEAPVTSSHTVGMPRSESIRPWSATSAQVSADPQLQLLMRSPAATPEPPVPAELPTTAEAAPEAATPSFSLTSSQSSEPADNDSAATESVAENRSQVENSEAEQQLWQDVERVIENTAKVSAAESVEVPAETAPDRSEDTPVTAVNPAASPAAEFTEPIPWGAPINPPQSEPSPTEATPPAAAAIAADEPQPAPPVAPTADDLRPSTPTADYATAIPALDAMQTAPTSPSPLVHPLRPPQRKRKSLSAVELPSFPPLPKVPHS